MQALNIFMLAITIFIFIDALPSVQSKIHSIPLKLKHRRAHKLIRRKLDKVELEVQQPDTVYYGTIELGDEEEELDVSFDTGSGDFFVPSVNCKSKACNDKDKYDPDTDDDFEPIKDKPFNIKYMLGESKGISGKTTLEIEDFTVEGQEFGLVEELADIFGTYKFDGVMGMAFSEASFNTQTTPITNLINKGDLDNPQFSFMLGRQASDTKSELTIGGTNEDRFVEPITWINLVDDNKGFWKIPIGDVNVNGQLINFQNRVGFIDTGSTLIFMSLIDAQQIYAEVPGSKEVEVNGITRFDIPCDGNSMSLGFGDMTWNIDPRDLIEERPNNVCFGSIGGIDVGLEAIEWVIGIPFLKNVYSVFDQGAKAVGFAKLKEGE